MTKYEQKVQIKPRKEWTKKQILDIIGEERYRKICENVKEKGNKISYKDFTPLETLILIDLTHLTPQQRDFAYLVYVELMTLNDASEYMLDKYNNIAATSYASVYKSRISKKLKETCKNICV